MKLTVEYVPITSIKPYKRNAKLHPQEQIEQIKASMREFGNIDPIGVWHNEIVEGHGRFLAAQQLGFAEVPVIRLDELSDEQRRAYALAHNKLTMNSGFDFELLGAELDDISLDMSLFGFLEDEDNEAEGVAREVSEDDYEPEIQTERKAKYGDVYQLGRHRLMCGDSTKAEDVEKLMGGVRAELCLTDPPYGVNIVQGATVGGDKAFGRTRGDAGGVVTLGSTRGEAKNAILKAKLYMPIKGDNSTETARLNYEIIKDISDIQIIFGGNYFTDFLPPSRCWIIWDKGVPKEAFFAAAELAWCSKDANIELYHYLWSGICREGDRDVEGKTRIHPTQKPVGLFGQILADFSKENDNVLDCFGGSGSTMIACEQTNRKCFMMEYEPYYVDVIIDRWEKFTGEKAVKISGEAEDTDRPEGV